MRAWTRAGWATLHPDLGRRAVSSSEEEQGKHVPRGWARLGLEAANFQFRYL